MDLNFKTFLLGKDGEENGRQDALAYNSENLLFAVADGVSNSYHPEFVAQALCELFVSMDSAYFDSWKTFSEKIFLPKIREIWTQRINENLASLSGRMLRHEQYNYDTWKYGASTFCGIYIDLNKGVIKFFIIGDSTLYVSTTDGNILEFNSSTNNISGNRIELLNFTNTTEAVISDGSLIGNWFIKELPIDNISFLALMTDGMAKWYQKHKDENPNSESILWDLQSKEEFYTLADNCRNNGDMDDDLAVVLIKLSSTDIEPSIRNCIIDSEKENVNTADNNITLPSNSKLDKFIVLQENREGNQEFVSSFDIHVESVNSNINSLSNENY